RADVRPPLRARGGGGRPGRAGARARVPGDRAARPHGRRHRAPPRRRTSMTGSSGFRVDTALLRAEAARWDEIAATFTTGVQTLQNDCDVFLWYLDSITAETEWQHDWVEASCEIINFS